MSEKCGHGIQIVKGCPLCEIDRLKTRIAELEAQVDDFKSASMLEISGDPADIEPHHVEEEITNLRVRVAECESVLHIDKALVMAKDRDRYREALEEIAELCGTPDPWQDDYDEIGRIVTEVIKEVEDE